MNKSKKYKYLRKNRHSKRITRKIQRGGAGNEGESGVKLPKNSPPTLTDYEKLRFTNAITAQKAANWTYNEERDWVPPPQHQPQHQPQPQPQPQPQHQPQPQPQHPPQQPNNQLQFDIPREQEQSLPTVSKSEEKPRLTQQTTEVIANMDPETKVAYISNNANKKNKSRERPDRRISLLAKSIPNAILGKIAGIGSESQQKLAKEEVLTTFTGDLSKIIEDSGEQVEIIREYNRLLNEEIKEIYKEIVRKGEINEEQKEDIKNLLDDVKGNNEYMKQLTVEASQLLHAVETGNLASFESIGFGMPSQASTGPGKSSNKQGFLSRVFGSNKTQKNPQPGATSSSSQPSSPGFLSRFTRKNKVSPDIQTPEVKAAADVHKAEQLEKDKQAGITRVPGKTIKSRITTGLTNMGKTMGSAFSNAGKTVKTGFGNLKNKLTRKNNKVEPDSTEKASAAVPDSTEKVSAAAPAAAPTQGIASPPKDIPRPSYAPPPPPPPSSPPTQETQEENTPPPPPPPSSSRVPPPPPPRPESFSRLSSSSDSQQSQKSTVGTVGNDNEDSDAILPKRIPQQQTAPLPPPPPPTPSKVPPPLPPPRSSPPPAKEMDPLSDSIPVTTTQGGGNITRKNRQYIREIKENRTQLFNKEMEIINSIRNFKHGHHHGHSPNEHGKNKPENIEKKFIKVIKRS
jgi:hypothetical protein